MHTGSGKTWRRGGSDGASPSCSGSGEGAAGSNGSDGTRERRLAERCREVMAIAQRGNGEQRRAAVAQADELLRQARQVADPWLLAAVLRTAGIVRMVTPNHLIEVRPILDELLEHTTRHGLTVAEADAYALRANRGFRENPEDDVVLDELAHALAILADDLTPDRALSAKDWAEQVARAHSDAAIVLHHIDLHEMAAGLLAEGQRQLEIAGEPHGMVVLLFNRARSLLLWGLQLERLGQPAAAAEHFGAASVLAHDVEEHWRQNLFPDQPHRFAVDQVAVFAVAFAMHRPGRDHLQRLTTLRERSVFADDPVLLDIAQARCLDQIGRRDEAVRLLEQHSLDDDPIDKSEPALRLSLARDIARLCRTTASESESWQRYAESLEAGLLSVQRARVSALRVRVEHTKLRRQLHAVTREALQDPLTGLPNRRALEQHMRALMVADEHRPLSVAMIDLDAFKQVNDSYSHAIGDDVLKVIAETLREVLRPDDVVARYGGDEFVVLLPGTQVTAAVTVLQRAVSKVADLPGTLSLGVTLSVGVTSIDAHDSAASALAHADRAMYLAKRQGGARVVVAAQP